MNEEYDIIKAHSDQIYNIKIEGYFKINWAKLVLASQYKLCHNEIELWFF